jgi:hypothetical protein
MKSKYSFFVVFIILLLSCSTSDHALQNKEKEISEEWLEDADYNLLFVGNSLTYTNDLPALLKEEAKKKDLVLNTFMLAKPNYAIIDHWVEGELQTLIKTTDFDFVIIQQGPSSQSEGHQMLINDGKKVAELCKANNARLAFFMVWPSRAYYETFEGVIANYTEAAKLNNAVLCPVGKVWKEHFDATGDFSYYGPDQFHPSLAGSKVAAKVILESLRL